MAPVPNTIGNGRVPYPWGRRWRVMVGRRLVEQNEYEKGGSEGCFVSTSGLIEPFDFN